MGSQDKAPSVTSYKELNKEPKKKNNGVNQVYGGDYFLYLPQIDTFEEEKQQDHNDRDN